MSADVDVLVIGGGISGLASAWWLGRAGFRVEVWEREDRIGGKIRTDRTCGYTTERGAALLMSFGSDVDALLTGSGLEHRKLPRAAAAHRYLVDRGALVPVPMRAELMMRSPLWSWRAKLRLLAEPLVPRSGREDETVSEFVRRRLGAEVLDKAMEPYVSGPLASDPELAEVRAVLPRLTALEARYGSLALGVLAARLARGRGAPAPDAFSFVGGMETLVATLANGPGVRVRIGTAAAGLAPVDGGFELSASDGGCRRARHVILGVPADEAARLIAPIETSASRLLAGIEYAPVNVVHLGFARADVGHALDGTGVLFPRAERTALTGCMWTSTLFPDRAPAARVLLDCYLGGTRWPAATGWDDARSVEACLATLSPLLGIAGAPEMIRVDRHARALPLYHGRHLERLGAIQARLAAYPGLHLAGNYDGGVSVRDRIACARALSRHVAATLTAATSGRRVPPHAARAPLPDAALGNGAVEAGT